jgi:hypothetical protein
VVVSSTAGMGLPHVRRGGLLHGRDGLLHVRRGDRLLTRR